MRRARWSRGRAVGLKRLAEDARAARVPHGAGPAGDQCDCRAPLLRQQRHPLRIRTAQGAGRAGRPSAAVLDGLARHARRAAAGRAGTAGENTGRQGDHRAAPADRQRGRRRGHHARDADAPARGAHQRRTPPHRRHRRRRPGRAAVGRAARAARHRRDLLDRHRAVGHRRAAAPTSRPVPADARLHVHLLPYQQGLRMQLLVRPLPGRRLLRARRTARTA